MRAIIRVGALLLAAAPFSCGDANEPDESAPPQSASETAPTPVDQGAEGAESACDPAESSCPDAIDVGSAQARFFGFGTSCSPNPCQNGGACVDQWLGYTCTCPAGFTGSRCQTRVSTNQCSPNPCQNGGSCTSAGSSFTCSCPAGFSGSRCETRSNVACPSPNPCQNGGTCVDGNNTFTCSCPPGFSGPRCEAETCQDATIASEVDRTTYRNCAEFRNLTVAGAGVSAITSSDFPYLTRVTGNLTVTGFAASGPSNIRLTGVTFPRLVSIGGMLQIHSNTDLAAATFAELTNTGSFDLGFMRLRNFSAPKLATINGDASLNVLLSLCTFDLRSIRTVAGSLFIGSTPMLPASTFAPLANATRGAVTREYLGCCFLTDRVGCEALSPSDFECGCQ